MKKNIVLIGMPGSGKTKIGKLVAKHLNKKFIDIDELIIEKTGRDPAEHLAELGDDKFLELEGKITQEVNVKNMIIGTTGSVPLFKDGINHLRQNGILVWMNIPLEIIKKRVAKRADGDSRIVGAQTMTMEEIRAFRHQKYNKNHDLIFTIKKEAPAPEVAKKLLKLLKKHEVC